MVIDECVSADQGATRILRGGEYLYRKGDARLSFFRVERGAIAIFEPTIRSPGTDVEIISQGDFVGLGYHDSYCETARAVVDTAVECISPRKFAEFIENDPLLKKRQADAIEREFEYRKSALNGRNHSTPMERVAAFLTAISHQNKNEGRDPTIVPELLEISAVGNLLGLPIDEIQTALAKLHNLGLIEWTEGRPLRLTSLYDLEHIGSDTRANH